MRGGAVAPILTQGVLEFISRNQAQTERIGVRLARLCQAGDVICLAGQLGAGKTCVVRGMARGLGISTPITSPSFVMIREHRVPGSSLRFYHIDLYRLQTLEEAIALGLEEYLHGDGICAIEWPERIEQLLPPQHLWIEVRYGEENQRSLLMKAIGPRYEEMLAQLRRQAFGLGSM